MGGLSRWLDVEVGADEIVLNTLPSNVTFADLQNDNEFKLIIGDFGKIEDGPRLKIFKGTMLVSDFSLPDLPLGVVAFYNSESKPRPLPLLAVAFSSCMYIYRSMNLFYKYYLPSIDLNPGETEVWKQLVDPENHKEETVLRLIENLKKIPEKVLSNQSKDFLTLNIEQQMEYLETYNNIPHKKYSDISCITTLKMSSVDKYAASCLVVGSEDGDVIILDPQTFTPLTCVKLCSMKRTPYQIVATGLYSVEYRLTVATREKCVCVVKRDWMEGRMLFATDDHITAIEVFTTDNTIMVICADNTLACYSRKGRKQWYIPLEHKPVAMTLVPVMHLGVTLVAVALTSGHLHLYDGKAKRDSLFIKDVVSVMKFGQLGQEEHVFTIITTSGNLMLKILKRTADFNSSGSVEHGASTVQKPWLIPKKSKLFLEQAARERENAQAMHTTFQLELSRLRLLAARTLLAAHSRADNVVAQGQFEPIRLAAEVEGLGPTFVVSLIVENTSPDKAVVGLYILFHVLFTSYKVSNPSIKVPLLSPGGSLRLSTLVEEQFDDLNPDVFFRPVTGRAGDAATLKVLLMKSGRSTPVLAATVQMPPTDPMMVPYDKIQATAAAQRDHDDDE
ncbi:Bardet-Biedl syndrome 1 protein homolog [Aricia agestis]|uniref:Bardet-Biedl syndrome 1 protein homolog n=1 Tax=Aricia agestis TaxID=91739 RepID=UPI001C2061B8|nr:Bardet-Biedl syndrome 1 protein homolog [Aricia agestis]